MAAQKRAGAVEIDDELSYGIRSHFSGPAALKSKREIIDFRLRE
jgi:hypothetical protein